MTALITPKPNNFSRSQLVEPPFGKGLVIHCDDLLQHVRCDRDLKIIGVRRLDKHMVAASFNRRQFLPEITWSHSPPLHSPVTEQVKGAATSGESKRGENLTFVNRVSFLPAASFVRRTAESFRPHDNDNGPDPMPVAA